MEFKLYFSRSRLPVPSHSPHKPRPETTLLMMHTVAADSVRIHNEMMHGGFVQFLKYAIPTLIAFVLLWTKFAKS